MSIRIGIMGYGNLGRGVELAVKHHPDMELAAIFTRRAPESLHPLEHVCSIYNPFGYFFKEPGTHLLSHTVSSIVSSAAYVLTVVFGMGTGVSHKRIGTRTFQFSFEN